MELKIWIYIIIGVIYVLRLISKNSTKKQATMPTPEIKNFSPKRVEIPTTDPNKPRPLTFDELLREITDAKTIREIPKPIAQPVYADYDDDLQDEENDLEKIPADYRQKDNKTYDIYEEAKRQAFYRPSLEETMKLQDTDVRFGKFKAFEQDEQPSLLDEYMKDLQDRDGFKKAFVMSEILKPRFSNAY